MKHEAIQRCMVFHSVSFTAPKTPNGKAPA